ncbi:MAG: tetratricopeptide repeat protein [Gammaproteobacteria bacterium]|nr:tetratricopeptide repeat protein [Gammaproteobacteria bacterium]MDD9896151.1 tetratricopeptide repeat protein [Gammaproteobacteria bacterium]MDD9959866.1 tetratricopeptide repeat protein [Gammaproteobacteria bacterium]
MKKKSKIRNALHVLAYASVVPAVILSHSIYAQDSASNNVLERYGNLDVTRQGPTIDAELAQKMFRRGNTYSNLQRYEEAIEEYRKAISADPNFSAAIRNLANTYYFLERYDEAKPLLARFIELENSPTAGLIAAVSTLGQLERQSHNFDIAIDYDLRAIELDPTNDSQVHIMANTYNNAGEADKAIAVYLAAVAVMPENAFFYRSLGRILEQEGRLEEALAEYESAAEKNPDSDFYVNLVETTRRRLGN